MDLKFQVQAKINKPRHEVFDAVYNPAQLSAYFTTGGATGPLAEGTTVIWRFADYPADIPVKVTKVVPDERILFTWDAADVEQGDAPGRQTTVEMTFETLSTGSTLVKISESGWKETQKGLNTSYSNCHGWTQMSCCLKAWVEHGINLREGFY